MNRLERNETVIGWAATVRGGMVRVRLDDSPSTLLMVRGESYRVGQIGEFLRIPLGYTHLYGVCTQVGADPVASGDEEYSPVWEMSDRPALVGYRWLTMVLFGEAIGGQFDRGVGMYPTVGDEVHIVTPRDLEIIYGGRGGPDTIPVGRIAGAEGIQAHLQVSTLVTRHSCVVGSTGSGKSNLVAVVLEELAGPRFPTARLLVVDPHGEYAAAVGDNGLVIRTGLAPHPDEPRLSVPYWALPFDELIAMTMGDLQPATRESLRDRVRERKVQAARHLNPPPPEQAVTADSPVPFSIRALWLELAHQELATFQESNKQDDSTRLPAEDPGDIDELRPPRYPPATSVNTPPYHNRSRWGIGRQLDLLRMRLLDRRFAFMFDPDDPLHPDEEGRVRSDLGDVIANWVGGLRPVTVLDVSGLPAEVLTTVVGTMVRLIYDALFWAMELPVGGRRQPLLVILDEAHRFLPAGEDSSTHRVFSRIAKEGRKYGVGLMIVSQRPSDLDAAVLSQCGTMLALRTSNPRDRAAVAGTIPDDLGGLTELLPSLRTGEGLVLGDALQVPSRVRIRKAIHKPVGDDPPLPSAWQNQERPDSVLYAEAVAKWRAQSTSTHSTKEK